MSGKPKTIPSASRNRAGISESPQMGVPRNQGRASTSVETARAGPTASQLANSSTGSDSPMDENFVNDDIIEKNSHVIPPTKKSGGTKSGRHEKKGTQAR